MVVTTHLLFLMTSCILLTRPSDQTNTTNTTTRKDGIPSMDSKPLPSAGNSTTGMMSSFRSFLDSLLDKYNTAVINMNNSSAVSPSSNISFNLSNTTPENISIIDLIPSSSITTASTLAATNSSQSSSFSDKVAATIVLPKSSETEDSTRKAEHQHATQMLSIHIKPSTTYVKCSSQIQLEIICTENKTRSTNQDTQLLGNDNNHTNTNKSKSETCSNMVDIRLFYIVAFTEVPVVALLSILVFYCCNKRQRKLYPFYPENRNPHAAINSVFAKQNQDRCCAPCI